MSIKKVEMITAPNETHYVGDGFRVHNFIPSMYKLDMVRMDPFIMMDYNPKYKFPPSDTPRGVGVHPHRGFETVTIAYNGKIQHHDSAGGGGIINDGDVQWMTAASGVLHKEYHEKEWSQKGGDFQMVQLWVNLPKKDKMSAPKYQAIENKSIPKVQLDNNAGQVEIIAGEYQNTKGPAETFTPIEMYNLDLNQDGKATFDFPSEYNTAMLVIEGKIEINGSEIAPESHFVLFENEGQEILLLALEKAKVLILSGQPINEPIAAHGPFVMNNREELIQAFYDFEAGKFGELED